MPMPLSSDKLHLTMTKSSTFCGLRDALLAVTTFPAAENTLSDFELAAGTGKTILTRCERSVKYTLQLSWFTLPKTRPEPDPEPGLLTITRPEPDPKSKSAIRQALHWRPTPTPSLKEVKLGRKKTIWETNFFLQDSLRLRRFQNFKKIHFSIFSELIALGVTLAVKINRSTD